MMRHALLLHFPLILVACASDAPQPETEPEPPAEAAGAREPAAMTAGALSIDFRLVHDEPAPGLERARYGDGALYLDPEPIAATADLVSVRPAVREDRLVLDVELTAEAATRLGEALAERDGQRLAIVVDGQPRSVPEIRSTEAVTRFQASIEMPPAEAERIAQLVRAHWPDPAQR